MSTTPYSTLLLWVLVAVIGLIAGVKGDDIVYVTTTVDASTNVVASPTAPNPASYTSFDDFKKTVLQVSNDYRRSHDAQPLVWNESLTDYALNWAKACVWRHSVRYSLFEVQVIFLTGFPARSLWREPGLWLFQCYCGN